MNNSRRNFLRAISCSSIGIATMPSLSFGANSIITEIPEREKPDSSLFKLFQSPPVTAQPFVRWWWNGNHIERKEITRQLDILKDAGIGGVEINPIMFPGEDDLGIKALEWLSNEWVDMVYFAAKEVHKRGMICDIIVGSGWPFGGEFLEKEGQTQFLTTEVNNYKLTGPGTIRISKKHILDKVKGDGNSYAELYSIRMVPSYMEKFEQGEELIDKFEDGILNLKVPYYVDQCIYTTVIHTGAQSVILGAPGASGPVLNHYNKSAVKNYLNRMSEAFNSRGKGMGSCFRSMFCDSLELSGKNWCDDMPEEFEKRRGYSIEPFIPFILTNHGHEGNPVGTKMSKQALDEINRVRYDYELTRQELFKERFLKTFVGWCRENNVKSRVQGFGTGYHPLEASMEIDIPECETWLGNHNGLKGHFGFTSVNKFVASGSKLSGKKLVSCEEITNISQVFFASLEMMKVIGDQSNLSGVNHSVFHGYNYSPESAEFPGWIRWGSYFNEQNTWWPFVKLFTTYKARLSAIFQNADEKADIAIMHPLVDKWGKYGQQFQPAFGWGERYPWYEYDLWNAIHQNGNTCDYISEKIIANAKNSNGYLNYNNCSYHTIVLMEVASIAPKAAKALLEFAASGGKIIFIGTAPYKCTGFNDYKEKDKIVKQTFDKIKADFPETCKVARAPEKNLLEWFAHVQNDFNITPPVKISQPDGYVSQVRFKTTEKELFFFINSNKEKKYSFEAEFNTGNKTPWIWNPETGERFLYPYKKDKNKLTIELSPAGSKLIVFDKDDEGEEYQVSRVVPSTAFKLTGSWEMEFKHTNGSATKKIEREIFDLKNDPEFKTFAGAITYKKTISLKKGSNFSIIDLGTVHGISQLWVNNKIVGTKWYGRHEYNCKDLLKPGKVTIKIVVTTIIGNYCRSLTNNKTCQMWTEGQGYEPLGLKGPVKLFEPARISNF